MADRFNSSLVIESLGHAKGVLTGVGRSPSVHYDFTLPLNNLIYALERSELPKSADGEVFRADLLPYLSKMAERIDPLLDLRTKAQEWLSAIRAEVGACPSLLVIQSFDHACAILNGKMGDDSNTLRSAVCGLLDAVTHRRLDHAAEPMRHRHEVMRSLRLIKETESAVEESRNEVCKWLTCVADHLKTVTVSAT